MLDFKFSFRWGRVIYVAALAAAIAYWYEIVPALICLLAIPDIRFEPGLFDSDEDVVTDDDGMTDTHFGPKDS